MKREFAKLTKAEQEKVELEYHQTKPAAFDKLMAGAKSHTPESIRLPSRLVKTLRTMAATEGEPEYQNLVRRWVEERLRQETKLASKPPRKTYSRKAISRRQASK